MSAKSSGATPQRSGAAVQCPCQWKLEGCVQFGSELSETRIVKSPFVIGRGLAADFQIPSANVSKIHADLVIAGDGVFLRDLTSSNGTFVNGRRIYAPTPVGDHDLLQFADREFRLRRIDDDFAGRTLVTELPQSGWLISRLHEVINDRRFVMA